MPNKVKLFIVKFFSGVLLFPLPVFAQQKTAEGFVPMKDGTKLVYKIFGNKGDTIIMLHGGPGQNMYGVGPDLEPLALNHVLLMYDQRGSGNSEIGPDTITARMHVDDIEDIRKHFHIRKINFVGQSWGAMLSVIYTSIHPHHVKKLLLISPGPPTRRHFDERFRAFARKDSLGQSRVRQPRSQLNSPKALANCEEIFRINERFYFADSLAIKKKKGNYCAVSAEAIRKQSVTAASTLRSLGDYDLRPLCRIITQPVLIIEGALTPVPLDEIDEYRNSFPNCQVRLFKKTGHGYPFVEEPKKFFKIADRFFKDK